MSESVPTANASSGSTPMTFIGQRKNVRLANRLVLNAKKQNEPFPNGALTGRSGNGKTRFAHYIAHLFETILHYVFAGPNCSQEFWAEKFAKVKPFDVVLIDEAHRLPSRAQEILYEVLVSRRLPTRNENGDSFIEIPPICILFATDQFGELTKPLRNRLLVEFYFGDYSAHELDSIARLYACECKLLLSTQARRAIVRASRANPRIVRNNMRLLKLFLGAEAGMQITRGIVRKFLAHGQTTEEGLTRHDFAALSYLRGVQGRTASLGSLAIAIGVDEEFFRRDIEPWLVQRGWLAVSNAGRSITNSGLEMLESLQREREVSRERKRQARANRAATAANPDPVVPSQQAGPAGG